ncbi:YeeE/YedE thiosulfate transporter family protein [Mangrovibacterium diazotrophicum]|uniref:Uncharacterized protein n=1 Tax=Mangrovibacterium diazotrophicum TaxID=1261403 RepID=A0A419W9B9_9BACT|nr:YeeE/YedE thiosulfate transporter family protein [Mangrovibacterium diazotrophicum]RKD92068.1 hypothetical protein BC643_2438 [Mangrovibacterium diazotrophicum]
MTTFVILLLGFLFGAIIAYANLNKYNVISGMAMLRDFTVAKAILTAIGLGSVLLALEMHFGLTIYHIKPFIATGIMLGGFIFGVGMAILGYCPGTMVISLGQGSLDALAGLVGGLLGGWIFTQLYPSLQGVLGPNWGALSISGLIESPVLFTVVVILFAATLLFIAFKLNTKSENPKDKKWLYAGIALAVLNGIVFLKAGQNRPIGASTSFPYMADSLTCSTANEYFAKIKTPGNWEMIFLLGALLAGFVIAKLRGEFKFTVVHSNWQQYRSSSKASRTIWAFFAGLILIFGARMAGGCTSGHVISGGMQLAVSSLVFGAFVFAGLLLTGKYFYR